MTVKMPHSHRTRETKLFAHINIRSLLPSVVYVDTIQELWDKLLKVNTLLSVHPEDVSTEVIERYKQGIEIP